MRALITGVTGFAGSHLAEFLAAHTDLALHGTAYGPPPRVDLARFVTLHAVDLRDPAVVRALVADLAPDYVFHLAAQAFVPQSWRDPWETLETNLRGELNVLEAVRARGAGRVLVIGSNEEYGRARPEDLPLREDSPLRPDSPYGVSKVGQDLLGLSYYLSYSLEVVRVRPFNHIGPRQDERFVAGAFARQIALIEAGWAEPVVRVGNLDAQRDFSDVRDVVRAYWLALTRGAPGAVYNIGSGRPRTARELLDVLLAHSTRAIRVEVDAERLRPSDVPVSYCDTGALRAATGWAPEIPFEQTVGDVLEDWRGRVRSDEC
jgi:GDP-4-dehydro-6-deoxy-D-mannose reductase